MPHEQDRDANAPKDTRGKFEEFTAGPTWRQLPLKIKLMVYTCGDRSATSRRSPSLTDEGSPPG